MKAMPKFGVSQLRGAGQALAALAACLACFAAHAQDYPSRPVRVVAPSAPGGGFDLVGRVLAHKLGEQTGQAFVVENRPGAGTLVGTQLVARAAADGYSLVVGGLSNIALNMGLYREPGYDSLGDLTPVSLVVSHSYTLVARRDLALASLKEVVDFARANPGKLNIGTGGLGSGQHIGAAIIGALAEVNMVKIPYKGAQPVYQDLLAGRLDLFYDNTTTTRPYVESGQVRALAVSSRARAPNMPQVPTIIETGVLDLEMETWFGLFAPARTSRAVIERLRAEVDKATRSAEVRSRLEMGSGRSLRMAPAETEAFARDSGDWEKLRATAHPDATMTTTWFDGGFDDFIESCQASWSKGSRSQHFLGGTVAEINGTRALAQTRMAIMVRSALDGVEVDAACYGRFFDRVEKRDGAWRIAKRSVIYEKDRIDPVDPGTVISLDLALLRRFPEGYRHLAYLQTKNGAQVNPNLPTARGEALDKLLREAQAWLAAAL